MGSIPISSLLVFDLTPGVPPVTWLDVTTSRLATYNMECFPMFSDVPFTPSCAFGANGSLVTVNITETHNLAFATLFDKMYYDGSETPSVPQIAFDVYLTRCRFHNQGECDFVEPVIATMSAYLMNEIQMMELGAQQGYAGILYLIHTNTPQLQKALTTLSGDWSGLRITAANASQFVVAKQHHLIGNDTGPIYAPLFEFAVHSSGSLDLSTAAIVGIVLGGAVGIVLLVVLVSVLFKNLPCVRKRYSNVDRDSEFRENV